MEQRQSWVQNNREERDPTTTSTKFCKNPNSAQPFLNQIWPKNLKEISQGRTLRAKYLSKSATNYTWGFKNTRSLNGNSASGRCEREKRDKLKVLLLLNLNDRDQSEAAFGVLMGQYFFKNDDWERRWPSIRKKKRGE